MVGVADAQVGIGGANLLQIKAATKALARSGKGARRRNPIQKSKCLCRTKFHQATTEVVAYT